MVESFCYGCCGYQVRDGESINVVFWKVVLVPSACNKRVGCIQRRCIVPTSDVLFDSSPLSDHQAVLFWLS